MLLPQLVNVLRVFRYLKRRSSLSVKSSFHSILISEIQLVRHTQPGHDAVPWNLLGLLFMEPTELSYTSFPQVWKLEGASARKGALIGFF